MKYHLVIDSTTVEASQGQSVLDAALAANIYIPHLCKHPDLEAMGGCRLCSVEINGSGHAVPACLTAVEEGMTVESCSDVALRVRRTALELILAAHPAECGDCPKYGRCELQSIFQYMGVSSAGRKPRYQPVPDDTRNPLILHRFTRCIKCGRCVRACRELRGVKAIDFQRIGGTVRIGVDGGVTLAEAGCRFCGACIEVCPTGSILDQAGLLQAGLPYKKAIVPCRSECPAGIDIPAYLRFIKNGQFSNALATIREKTPFPNTLGHVCTHNCESKCKRNQLGGALSICQLKRFSAKYDDGRWQELSMKLPDTGKRIAVVGAGPAGLTAAFYLRKRGHAVTVLEANPEPGGQLRYGIPTYRLPIDVLNRDIDIIQGSGIELQCDRRVRSLDELADYDAVLVALGTHKGIRLPLEGNDLPGVIINIDFLKAVRIGNPPMVAEDVAVLGGGSVAFDCARTALRLGAQRVHVICLEARDQMTASSDEIEEGLAEGVIVHDACSFIRLTGTDHVTGVEIEKVLSFSFDANHKAVIVTKEDSRENILAGTVIFAVGQMPEYDDQFGLTSKRGNRIETDTRQMTAREGVFACGDVVSGTQSVIKAIAAGRQAASNIDIYLGGNGVIDETLTESKQEKNAYIGRIEGFSSMIRMKAPLLAPQDRLKGFWDQTLSLDPACAQSEASRCLQCDLRLEITTPRLWNDYMKETTNE
ncbi:MAG: FAD-dependent oxidoreductase [Saccharofermentanales bacterium]|jgi:formate dehydrogenase beta subunit